MTSAVRKVIPEDHLGRTNERTKKPYRLWETAETTERDRLLAATIANQQAAGFGKLLDIRQFSCPDCKSAGFNSGWGTIEFECGSSWLPGDDADVVSPCTPKPS